MRRWPGDGRVRLSHSPVSTRPSFSQTTRSTYWLSSGSCVTMTMVCPLSLLSFLRITGTPHSIAHHVQEWNSASSRRRRLNSFSCGTSETSVVSPELSVAWCVGRNIADLEGADLIDTPTSLRPCSTASGRGSSQKGQELRGGSVSAKRQLWCPPELPEQAFTSSGVSPGQPPGRLCPPCRQLELHQTP